MTDNEFKAWATHTARSRNGWMLDEVTAHNRGEMLLYRGGERGVYVLVSRNVVTVGRYEGAVPHIGEAMFTCVGQKAFANDSRAFEAVANATGLSGLMALLTGSGDLTGLR